MKPRLAEFIVELGMLLYKYQATLSYTNSDDGIHVEMDGEDVCIGFPNPDMLNEECGPYQVGKMQMREKMREMLSKELLPREDGV